LTEPLDDIPRDAVWVRLPRFIGDSVMIHQALEPLRVLGVPLVAWGTPAVTELFRGSDAFQGAWSDAPEGRKAWAMARILRQCRARAVLNLPRSLRALLAAWIARVPRRVGWREGGGRLLATHSLPFQGPRVHQLARYGQLLDLAFPDLPRAVPRPFRPRPEAFALAREAAAAAGLSGPFVALGLGAMSPNKRLSSASWIGLAGRMKAAGLSMALLGGPGEDEAQAAEILAAHPGLPSLAGRLPLSVVAALLHSASALVGNDSALGHLAAACGVPVLSVFGPTDPGRTAPVGERVRVLRVPDLPCMGCGAHECAVEGHPCMDVPGALLWEAYGDLMGLSPKLSPGLAHSDK
jgi:heptosyltransferase-2